MQKENITGINKRHFVSQRAAADRAAELRRDGHKVVDVFSLFDGSTDDGTGIWCVRWFEITSSEKSSEKPSVSTKTP